jgi:hypothetical protein
MEVRTEQDDLAGGRALLGVDALDADRSDRSRKESPVRRLAFPSTSAIRIAC